MADLILTNGDSAADLLAAAGKTGRILPWRDVLHEGPILFDLDVCSRSRVAYLARRFGIDTGDVAAEFAARDAVIGAHAGFERIELWFEHDLYDQLQLLQILAFFAEAGRTEGVVLVQADDFLGSQTADTILRFAKKARPVEEEDLDLAELLWADLAMPTPVKAFRHLFEPQARLPHFGPALRRFLEELPSPANGLGRTEATALAGIAAGKSRAADLFRDAIAAEEAAFMGDISFFLILDDLAECGVPLISRLVFGEGDARDRDAIYDLTGAGEAVLAGTADHVALNGLDRWWAGTRQLGRSVWRYDRDAAVLVPPATPGP